MATATTQTDQKWKCEGAHRAGPAWAALDANETAVLAVRTKWAPPSTDYEKYRTATVKELEAIGKIRVGEIVYEQGACWFVRTVTAGRKMNLEAARKVKSEYVKGSGRHLAALNPAGTKLLGAFPARAPAGTAQEVWMTQITAQLGSLGKVQMGTMKQEGEEFFFYWAEEKKHGQHAKPQSQAR